ncbi:MAG: c-type cytochrome, partial [Burkholderiales bacterium]
MFLLREGLREIPQMAGLFNGFTDRDLTDVAAHFARQTPPRGNTQRDPQLHARGAGLAQAMGCGSCHLQDYRGQKQVPRLTGLPEDYLAATMKAYRDNKRSGTDTSMNG